MPGPGRLSWGARRDDGQRYATAACDLTGDRLAVGARHATVADRRLVRGWFQELHWPANCAACGLPLCPASFMIGGTSGSDTKFCQPCSSQSKTTHTRSASEGSRKMSAPWDPCSWRFSAPLVEKISRKWSKSSICV